MVGRPVRRHPQPGGGRAPSQRGGRRGCQAPPGGLGACAAPTRTPQSQGTAQSHPTGVGHRMRSRFRLATGGPGPGGGGGGGQTPSTGGVHELGESVPTEPRPSSPGSRALVPVSGGSFPTLRGAGLGDQVLSSPAGRGKRELDRPQVTGVAAGPRAGPKASVSSPRPLTAPALHGDPRVGRPASFPGQVVHPPS